MEFFLLISSVEDARRVASKFFQCARLWGLAPNERTVLKSFGNKKFTEEVLVDGEVLKWNFLK